MIWRADSSHVFSTPMCNPSRLLIALLFSAALFVVGCGKGDAPPKGPITFNQHIAPIVFSHCSQCHRPGQAGRFSLLNFADAKAQAPSIVEAIQTRYMPPFLPDGPIGVFQNDPRLTDAQIALFERWLKDGLLEGNAADLPPLPKFPDDWPLGKPDLVVAMPEPYAMAGDGPDVYRNFVIPIGNQEARWVRAIDIRPNGQAVHHALVAFDHTGKARKRDAQDAEPGFSSFTFPPYLDAPNHFLGWLPGKHPRGVQPGLQWRLEPKSDVVIQTHMRPMGRRDEVKPQVAFYFASEPPTNQPLKIQTSTLKIEIPAGVSNHVVHAEFPIAGEAQVLAVNPHAHFLAREMTLRVRLPNGTRQTLLHIPKWDFNWQDYYYYAKPPVLPAGSMLETDMVFDNSMANPHNPNQPPKTVRYGVESTDEMSVMALQIMPTSAAAAKAIEKSMQEDLLQFTREFNTFLLQREPTNVQARVSLGRYFYITKNFPAATEQLAIARQLDPQDEDAALLSGIVAQFSGRPDDARRHFEECIAINRDNARAHGCLAVLAGQQGWYDVAETHLYEALRVNPNDAEAKSMLRQLKQQTGRR
jgi:hypothetical protein